MEVRMRRRHPKFFDTEEGRAAATAYTEKLTKEALHSIDKAFSEAIFDPRHAALQRAKAADDGVEITPGWDREAVLAVMQMRSAERATAALSRATWALVGATVVLAFATIALAVAAVMTSHG